MLSCYILVKNIYKGSENAGGVDNEHLLVLRPYIIIHDILHFQIFHRYVDAHVGIQRKLFCVPVDVLLHQLLITHMIVSGHVSRSQDSTQP